MSVTFGSKTSNSKVKQSPKHEAAEDEAEDEAPASKSWFKRGAASAEAVEQYEQEMQQKWEDSNRMREYWLEDGEEGRITFVDGDLTEDGHLDILTYREHHLKDQNGNWGNKFVCTAEADGPCPICQIGNESYLVGVLTVIDHREFKSTKKEGVTYQYMPRLYKAKKNTIKKLQSLAVKRGGLAGCTFDVSRIGENAPRVGSDFDFVQKDEIDALREHFSFEYEDPKTKKTVIGTRFEAADYQKEIAFIPSKELREKYGFGTGNPIGASTATLPMKGGSGKSKISFKGKM